MDKIHCLRNTIHSTALVVFTVMLLASCNQKQKPNEQSTTKKEENVSYADSSSSTVKVFTENGKVCVQQTSSFYQLTDVYEGSTKIPLLLKIRKTELCVTDSVNKHRVYEIEAHSILDSKTIAWQNSFVATNIEFKDNTLYAIHEGVDSEEDFITRFSLTTGKPVFSCSYGDLKVAIPNVKEKRFIGYTSLRAASNPIGALKEENLLGLIKYSNSSAEVNTFKLKLKRSAVSAKIPHHTPDMILIAKKNATVIEDGKQLILMKADEHYTPKDVSNFSVKFSFYYGDDNESTEITIPVQNDRLILSGAKFDKEIFELTGE